MHTIADVTTITQTVPENKFVPNNSVIKLRSASVHTPRPNSMAPPIYVERQKQNIRIETKKH